MAANKSTDNNDRRWDRERRELLELIDADFVATASYTGKKALDSRIRKAMANVPRHLFVPDTEKWLAYVNHALPIGHEQTISQPYVVALMTDLLAPKPDHVVLEVGTGSGYQAAVLSSLVRQLYSIEVIEELATSAAERLQRLGYDNVEVRAGDGSLGWPEHAPYDGIIVTAAARDVPPALVEQLKPGGRMVIPVGRFYGQDLRLLEKHADGSIKSKSIIPVAFVPLTGEGAPATPAD
jgi:protein-L-isoaspartate(D-aspartate) O-methyltransferase